MKLGAYYIQEMSNGDKFYCRIESRYKNGNYLGRCVDHYIGMSASRVKKSRINNSSLWKLTETLPLSVESQFYAFDTNEHYNNNY